MELGNKNLIAKKPTGTTGIILNIDSCHLHREKDDEWLSLENVQNVQNVGKYWR